jgi:hypothetical protein
MATSGKEGCWGCTHFHSLPVRSPRCEGSTCTSEDARGVFLQDCGTGCCLGPGDTFVRTVVTWIWEAFSQVCKTLVGQHPTRFTRLQSTHLGHLRLPCWGVTMATLWNQLCHTSREEMWGNSALPIWALHWLPPLTRTFVTPPRVWQPLLGAQVTFEKKLESQGSSVRDWHGTHFQCPGVGLQFLDTSKVDSWPRVGLNKVSAGDQTELRRVI